MGTGPVEPVWAVVERYSSHIVGINGRALLGKKSGHIGNDTNQRQWNPPPSEGECRSSITALRGLDIATRPRGSVAVPASIESNAARE